MKGKEFVVILEKDEDGWFIAEAPEIPGCHTQGKTKKEAMENIKEAIELCLEVQEEKNLRKRSPFVSVEKVLVHA